MPSVVILKEEFNYIHSVKGITIMNRNLYTKIAYWYYVLGLTQDEIAKRLNFTRQKVNQMINSLKELDIVHVTVRGFEQDNVELETILEQKYGLKECLIVTDYGETETAIYKVAHVAAQYLEDTLKNGDTIGVSWGRTLAKIVEQMEYRHKPDCRVVSLLGALNISQTISKADEIARNFANKLDCPSIMLYAPLVVENRETKEWLLREKHIKQTFDLMKQCNIAVLGIGSLTEKTSIYGRGVISKEELQELCNQGFVGDIATNLVRPDGTWDSNPLNNRLLAADLQCLKDIDNLVAVAAGETKAEAIQAVLQSGCIDTLIVDETTARKIILYNQSTEEPSASAQ